MLNPNFFRAKTFNIFYIFGREKISTSSIRAPIKPRKFPQKHLENPQKHIEFSTSDVFLPLYRPKKRGKNPVFRALSSSLVQIYNIFARNANCVNILKHFGNVKRRLLHTRASAMYYITRPGSLRALRLVSVAALP